MDYECLKTERLYLRPWKSEDVEELFRLACDPEIGPSCGWRPHKNVEQSRQILEQVLSVDSWAVCDKETGRPLGSIGLMIGKNAHENLPETQAEIGYWIGKPCWGKGLIPEAVNKVMKYGFNDLGMEKIWCGYFEGNGKSRRVSEKCGFKLDHVTDHEYIKQLDDYRRVYSTVICKDEWKKLVE